MPSLRIFLSLLLVVAALASPGRAAEPAATLFLCGMDEVFAVDPAVAETGTVTKLWSWRAKDHDELPEAVRGKFGTTDDCKPVKGLGFVLISSSGGACAVVELSSGRVLWYARVPNAHSLELLPHSRVVVASSTAADGNRLVLFDLSQPDAPIRSTPMISAHGVIWDESRQCLWASGAQELRRYQLTDWDSEKPSLTLQTTYPLPDGSAHDLQPVPGTNDLVISTGSHVYLFDREKQEFRLHPELGNKADVKCVSTNPVTGQIAFLQAQDGAWWSNILGFVVPEGAATFPNERLYKARWLEQQMVRHPNRRVNANEHGWKS